LFAIGALPAIKTVVSNRIGFTGSKHGMPERQKTALRDLLASYAGASKYSVCEPLSLYFGLLRGLTVGAKAVLDP